MATNRFAILTDGFAKPGTIVGSDWASKIGRALLVTEGYFNRSLSTAVSNYGNIMRIIIFALIHQILRKVVPDSWR